MITGLDISINGITLRIAPLLIGIIAFWLLFSGNFKRIQNFLVGLVVIMSSVFITTAIIINPSISDILKGLFIPQADAGQLLMVMALVGTTVVPYNLFLHAATISEKYKDSSEIHDLRIENAVAIVLGGLISMAIVITSAAAFGGTGADINNAADMAKQLEPLLGSWSAEFLGIGLFAAGISSAITAPLAAAYAANGILGWNADLKNAKFRSVWMGILFIGVVFSMIGFNPIQVIQFAQVANGILLPFVAIFLLYIMNRTDLLGSFANTRLQNSLGICVIVVALIVGFRSLNTVFHFLQ